MKDINENDIAVVGMALRVPGANTPEQFWHNLSNGIESRREYADEELLERGVSRSELADPNYVKAGMPLDGMEEFDPEFFGFSPKEAAILDPQHRQFYEVAWEAIENAALPPERFDGNVGVFGGSGMAAYFARNIMTNAALMNSVGLFLLRHTGNDKDFLATRVAYAFNLQGPAVNIQTACSTSLVAVHIAVQSLLSGECDMALAGGSTIELPHRVGYLFKEGEILSPDGHCRPFDHRSKGTVFGSGCGVIALRRLADALESGDHIHAVIKGTAVNNDGSGKVGYLAPSVDGQAAAITEAIAVSGVDPETVGFIECHGTGTPVGDPIEVAALTNAFRQFTDQNDFCLLGSVKSNIGHTDTAAGIIGLIKAALAVEHGQVPPSLGFEAPNPAIPFDGSPFRVAAALQDWPALQGPRRAAVNSLGVGGTNAFAIIEEAPAVELPAADTNPQVLVLSARNPRALDDASLRLADWLEQHPQQPLADVAWTLYTGRHAFEHRRVLAVSSHEEAVRLLREPDLRRVFSHVGDLDRPSLVFMFPGGGAQYMGMGRQLYDREPVFREHVDRGLTVLRERHDANLAKIFMAPAGDEAAEAALHKPSVQLPLIFILEIALTRLWESYGIRPAAVMGHSLGENTAACVAGVLSFEDALGLVMLRGQLMDEVPRGAMLSVSMPAAELQHELGEELDLAASNSPQLSVASGSEDAIANLEARLAARDIDARRVRIDIAAHSRLLDGVLERFREYLRSIRLHEPTLPVISNRTGKWLRPEQATSPDYWVEHLRNGVMFADGVDTLLETPDRVFLEVGPGHTLGSLVRQNPGTTAQRVLASLRHPDDEVADDLYLRAVLGRLWALGINADIESIWVKRRRIALPTYPFQHESYWVEPGAGPAVSAADDMRPLRQNDPTDWYHTTRWVQQGILEFSQERHTWLLFSSDEPASSAAADALRSRGDAVVIVRAGDTFSRLDSNNYMLAPEAGGAGYAELVGALADDQLIPDRILHTWLLTWDTRFRAGSTFFHRNQEYGFYSLFHLAQALGKAGHGDDAIHWIVAASDSQRVGHEMLRHPDKATALGPCAVIGREFPAYTCRYVDVKLPADVSDTDGIAEALQAEALAAADSGVVAWRHDVRWQRHLAAWQPDSKTAQPRLQEQGVYLITGGLGGIAGALAERLIQEYSARLVLVGRTPLPARDMWDEWLVEHGGDDSISRAIIRVRQLEAQGGEVLALAGDVAVAERMAEIVDEARDHFGPINGVFHTAGVIRDNLIQLKSQRDIEEVFSAKLYGTVVLDKVLANEPLDFMVLFSSNSAFVAPQGQIDYVAANAFLNAWADAHSGEKDYPVLAVNWGIWKEIGMVAGESAADANAHDVSYPLFRQRRSARDGVLRVHTLRGLLSARDHWVVDEHRLLDGSALLPGTGYLELVRAALAECGVKLGWAISNLVFLNPLFVDDAADGQPFEIRLRGNKLNWEVEIATINAATGQRTLCATCRVTPPHHSSPADLPLDDIRKRCTGGHESAGGSSALRTRQEDHLRFGDRWRVLKRSDRGEREALGSLTLAATYTGDLDTYELHPALLDIATGFAMDLIPGYAEQDIKANLWAPMSYKRFERYAALPTDVVSWVRLNPATRAEDGFAVFDISVATRSGQVVAEVEQLTLRRLHEAMEMPGGQADSVMTTAEGAPVTSTGKQLSPGEEALLHNLSQGIGADEGIDALISLLSSKTVPPTLIISSMTIPDLLRQADAVGRAGEQAAEARFGRPELASDFEAPRNPVEEALAELWGKLLGVDGIGINDSFFDLGGHSLIAVRLFNEISQRYDVDLPISVLMQSPTVAGLAELIQEKSGADPHTEHASEYDSDDARKHQSQSFEFIVPMHSGAVADGTPLFMVSGMFGNVLNLSHMAHLLGEERPFYALQARGLYGDTEPHVRFEDMARDYLAEVRKVQPEGPYLLGGFSGGGLAAYEMARQLLDQGEAVLQVILLDTPITEPSPLSVADRIEMTLQGLRDGGAGYLTRKLRDRIAWEKQKRAGNAPALTGASQEMMSFQSERIGAAFVEAVDNYTMPSVPVLVALFRPRLDVRFTFRDGRRINVDRRYVAEDNLWTPYVAGLEVVEVPGNHDNMVLEPNVRVLVAAIRKIVSQAESASQSSLIAPR